MKRFVWAVPVLAIVALWVMRVSAAGLSVSFLNPPAGNWAAGLDFATDVLGDPWDMNSMNDISIDPLQRTAWSSIGVNGGTGVPNAIGGSYVGPGGMTVLYQGHYGVINTHRNGRQFPIDTNLFRRLAFKLKTQNAVAPIVWWFHRPYSHPSGEGIGGGTGFLVTTPNTYQITTVNLSSMPGTSGEAWTLAPTAVGLRIDPRPGSGAAENIFFDWVRLTAQDDGTSSAMQTVQWSPSGAATVSVTDSNGTTFNVACAAATSTSCRWNYGILPAGTYNVHVQQGGNSGDIPFTINATPSVQVTAPSMTSGEDYATAKQLNPWDMNDPADIDNDWIGSDHITESWPGTELVATSDGVCASDCGTQPTGDPEIYMLANNEPGINRGAIDGSKYRYLTLTMQIDHAYDLFAGSVGRILFGHTSTFQNGISPHYNLAVSEAFLAWPGNVTYSIDLGALGVGTDQGIVPGSPAPLLWNNGTTIRQLRIDPHEFAQVVDTHLSDVKLTAMSEVAPGNNFSVTFTASDPDGGSPSVRLYRDTDKNPSTGLVEITTSPLSGVGSYNWNTSGVPVGNYYIYALVTDGINAFGRYSEAPVRVGLPASGPPDPLLAFNSPAPGATTGQSFSVTGWSIDRGAGVGTGIDQVHVYAYPAGGGAPIGLGVANYGIARSDVAAIYGAQFTNSGFSLSVSGLATGGYTITAFGHSTVTGTFNVNASVAINVSGPVSQPAIALGAPMSNSTTGSTVTVNGWAIDRGAPSGTGVNLIHVYAFPTAGGSPLFLGAASYGAPRSDIAAIYGAQFTNSGFSLQTPVPQGNYTFVAYMRSTISNAFTPASSPNVTVNATNSNPTMLLDGPPNGATRTRPFTISGWAVDTGAASGTGINAVHIWAFPVNGSPQFFVGVATYGTSRPDVGTYLGDSRYNNSGFTFTVTSGNVPAPGTYDFQVFGRSTVTGGFTVARIVRVTVQ